MTDTPHAAFPLHRGRALRYRVARGVRDGRAVAADHRGQRHGQRRLPRVHRFGRRAAGGRPDPVPQAMVLTGIVVAVCATGLALTLADPVQPGRDRLTGRSPRERRLVMALVPIAALAGRGDRLPLPAPRAARWSAGRARLPLLPLAGARRAGAPRRPVTQSVGGWVAPLGIRLRADGLSAILLLASRCVGLLISIYARSYFGPAPAGRGGAPARYFWPLWLFLLAALNAMFLSGDLFNLYVTLELQRLSAVALVALAGNRAALDAALRYLFVSLSGSLFYLMGVALVYGGFGTLDLELLAGRMTRRAHSRVALVSDDRRAA